MKRLILRTVVLKYGFAVVSIALAIRVRLLLDSTLGDRFPYSILFFAVLLTAWLGGLRPAILAVLIGAIASTYFLLPPRGSFALPNAYQRIGLTFFIVTGMGIALLGGLIHGLGTNRDISKRRRAEVELRAVKEQVETRVRERTAELVEKSETILVSEARMGVIVNSAMDAIISVDAEQRVVIFNAAAERMFRCPAESAIGQSIEAFIPQRFRETHQQHIEDFGKAGVSSRTMQALVMLNGLRVDGEEFPIEASISQVAVEGEMIFTAILRDVTERNRAEEKFRLAVESAPNAVVISNREGHIVLINQQTEKLFGYSRSELLGQSADILVPERFRVHHQGYRTDFHSNPVVRSMGGGRDLYSLRKDGSEFPVEISLTPIHADDGLLVLSAIVDISERRRAEKKFRLAVESAPNGVVMVNNDGEIVLVNQQTERLFGYERAELLGQPVEILIPERFRGKHPGYREDFFHDPAVRAMGVGRDLFGLRKDGSEFPVEIGLTPIQTDEENLVMSAIVDITERKRAESELRASEERLRIVTDNARVGLVMVDCERRFTFANSTYAEMLDLPSSDLVGQRIADVLVPIYDEQIRPRLDRAFAGERVAFELHRSTPKENRCFTVSYEPTKVDGIVSLVVVVITDISERKRAEEARRESEARYRTLFEYAPDGIVVADSESNYIDANNSICRMLGYTRDELIGLNAKDIVSQIEVQHVAPALNVIRSRSEYHREWEFRRKDGSVFPAEVIATMMPDGNLLGMIRDITERQRAVNAVRQSEDRLSFALEMSGTGAWDLDLLDHTAYRSVQHDLIFGYQEHLTEWTLETFLAHVVSEDRDEVGRLFSQAILEKKDWSFECRIRRDDGELRWIWASGRHRYDESGAAKRMAGIVQDITERKQAEEIILQLNAELEQRVIDRTTQLEIANIELRNRQAELKSLFDSLPGLYLVLDLDLKIISASDAYLEATLMTRESILGRSLFEAFPDNPNDPTTTAVANMSASINRVLENGAPDIMAIQKHDVRRPDGAFEERYWSPINSAVFEEDRQIKYIVHRVEDVTEFVLRKSEPSGSPEELSARVQQMKAEIFQSSQKLQAANRQLEAANKELEAFSYSVSHDLRAPLRHINGFSLALLEDYDDKLDETGKDFLRQVRNASQEMAQLIDDVLQLARVTRTDMHSEPINLSEMAHEVIDDLRKTDRERSVIVDIEEGLTTKGDKRLLQIMFANLLGNAWKFTSRKETANISFGQSKQNGESSYFVRDNGAGFDMAYGGKLFGTFQRLHTNSEFEGTGIGLATVRRIVNRHGGAIWAEAIVNQGATFHFTLSDLKKGQA